MTGREKRDRIFNSEFRWWPETLIRWHKEGLPEEIKTNGDGDNFFLHLAQLEVFL